jgi:hypothetical protein
MTKGRRAFPLCVSNYPCKGDARCLGHVSFCHECGHISHSVSHHESARVSFYHESRCVSHSGYRDTHIRIVHLRFISLVESTFQARAEQWRRPILPCSCPILTISFPFWRCRSKNLAVMKYKKGLFLSSSRPPTLFVFTPLDLDYHCNRISLM